MEAIPNPRRFNHGAETSRRIFSLAGGDSPAGRGTVRASGAAPGHDLDNWCAAEAEIVRETAGYHTRLAIVVIVNGVVYTGEYESAAAEGYLPGEWKPGDPVPVRLSGDKLYLRRGDGRELQTTIVKRIG